MQKLSEFVVLVCSAYELLKQFYADDFIPSSLASSLAATGSLRNDDGYGKASSKTRISLVYTSKLSLTSFP